MRHFATETTKLQFSTKIENVLHVTILRCTDKNVDYMWSEQWHRPKGGNSGNERGNDERYVQGER